MLNRLYRVIKFVESKTGSLDVAIVEANLFGYDADDNEIYITDEKDDVDIAWDVFMVNYLQEEFEIKLTADNIDVFSLLHEIGHYKTMNMVNDYDAYEQEVDALDDDDFLSYRKLYVEYIADDWATSFIKNYPEVLTV